MVNRNQAVFSCHNVQRASGKPGLSGAAACAESYGRSSAGNASRSENGTPPDLLLPPQTRSGQPPISITVATPTKPRSRGTGQPREAAPPPPRTQRPVPGCGGGKAYTPGAPAGPRERGGQRDPHPPRSAAAVT